MANSPTVGVFIPGGYLNTCNSPGVTGQQDAFGNNYPTGTSALKMIELGSNEAQNLAAPGTSLYEGAYQWVQLDSSATAANAAVGMAAYIKIDSTASAYTNQNALVTTYDQVSAFSAASLGAGVFINPTTFNGQSNLPTPGNWCFIFVGSGAAQVNISTATGTAIGNTVDFNGSSNSGFTSNNGNTQTAATLGVAMTAPSVAHGAVVYTKNIIYRLPN